MFEDSGKGEAGAGAVGWGAVAAKLGAQRTLEGSREGGGSKPAPSPVWGWPDGPLQGPEWQTPGAGPEGSSSGASRPGLGRLAG